MNSSQFKNLLFAGCNKLSKLYMIEAGFYNSLDEIRKSNDSYKKIASDIHLNPHHKENDPEAEKKLKLIKEDIIKECIKSGIKFAFLKIDSSSHKEKRYVIYTFQNIALTSIINI